MNITTDQALNSPVKKMKDSSGREVELRSIEELKEMKRLQNKNRTFLRTMQVVSGRGL